MFYVEQILTDLPRPSAFNWYKIIKKGDAMDCPHCHINLISKEYEHLSVSVCQKCEGIWLEPSQLSQIITKRDEQFSSDEIQNTLKAAHPGLSPAETPAALSCPVCSAAMEKINYDYSSGVVLNSCPKGDGLWFDKNELEAVQIFMEHWDDKENIQEQELLAKLKKDREDLEASEAKELQADNTRMTTLSKESVFERVFQLFDSLKMYK
jgi:Zn-finger nucleic acid-binding protein